MAKESKEAIKFIKELLSNRKFQIILTIIIFLAILISSTTLRTANLELLKDATTGKYLPADPDACYELRIAQTLVDNGNIDGIDSMRNPGLNLTYAQEMLPKILAFSYKTMHFFGSEITLDKVDVLYPVVAFALGLIIFFLLCWYLSKSKIAAVIASALLAYSPSYLSRTTGGVSSHESLGMPFMFLAMLVFAIALSKFDKNWKNTILFGIGSGICFALSFFSWSGASNFVLMAVSISLVLFYLFGLEDSNISDKIKFIAFSILWVISSVLIMPLFGFSFSDMYGKFLSNYGILVLFTIAFMIVDSLLIKYREKMTLLKSKYRIGYSLLVTFVLGIIGLMILGKNPIDMLSGIYTQILFPMGLGRVGLTVAYYAQPYMSELVSQYTPTIFWLFVIGMIFMGVETSKSISSFKHKIGFVLAWTIAIFGMMFSRVSSTSLFNGTNFISQAVYILSFLIFAGYFIWLYFNDKFRIDPKNIFLFAWMFVMLLSTRSAVRVIFVIYAFVAFAVAFAIINLYVWAKKTKDSTGKIVLYFLMAVSILFVITSLFGNPITNSYGSYQITKYSAANMGPIADNQWQLAMEWVRNNTASDAVFAHWWDYGYQIQLLANRTTVLDGGNAQAYWNYMMGRYVLTTPVPSSALSFMKSHNVSYLLIDPTDLGKYAAYSKIGSNNDWDRYSSPNVMVMDSTQTRENVNGTSNVYTGGSFVDEDINYNGNFIPGPTYDQYGIASYKSYIAGVIIEISTNNAGVGTLKQPQAVFIYNNKQIRLPIRYVYYAGQIHDFKTGVEATFRIVPQVTQSSTGQISINQMGAGIYISSKVSKGLFAQIYLMDDPWKNYPTLKKAVFEDDSIVKSLNSQGANLGEFVYFNGLRGPLKIWKVEYPANTKINKEFFDVSGEYGALDSLSFVN